MKKPASSAPYPDLEKFRPEIARCVKCGSCRAVCPTFFQGREESLSARGRLALVKAMLDGQLAASAIYQDRLASCTSCLACEAGCASKVPVAEIIQAAKEQAVKESGAGIISRVVSGVLTHPALFKATAWLGPVALHYSAIAETPAPGGRERSSFNVRASGQESPRKRGQKNRTAAFFPGCAINHFHRDIGSATRTVLTRLDFDVIVPKDLKCCGRPLLSLGDRKTARELAVHNASLLSALEADVIVTACASCGLTFKKEYPKLLGLDARVPAVLDILEVLAANPSDQPLNPVKKIATWHDPCHLGRGQGLAATARELLCRIPGLTFREMEHADTCCGFGGVMRITHHGLSDSMADEKVKSIIAAAASTVVTACPGCRMQISDGLRRAGSDVEVLHIVQMIEEALGGE